MSGRGAGVASLMAEEQVRRLILLDGQEGAGKTTIIRALLPHTPNGAVADAEDVGHVNPCPYDAIFFDLLYRNVAGLIENFWRAGYLNVVSGSMFSNFAEYCAFRQVLVTPAEVYVVQLRVAKEVRDHRRETRAKQTTQQWRDHIDQFDVVDTTLQQAPGDYRYIGIDTSLLSPTETVARIKDAIPDVYDNRD